MKNSKAGVFLNSLVVVGIQRRPLWVHKPPLSTVEMVESALPRSQTDRGRRSESGLRGASDQGASEALLGSVLSFLMLRVS